MSLKNNGEVERQDDVLNICRRSRRRCRRRRSFSHSAIGWPCTIHHQSVHRPKLLLLSFRCSTVHVVVFSLSLSPSRTYINRHDERSIDAKDFFSMHNAHVQSGALHVTRTNATEFRRRRYWNGCKCDLEWDELFFLRIIHFDIINDHFEPNQSHIFSKSFFLAAVENSPFHLHSSLAES